MLYFTFNYVDDTDRNSVFVYGDTDVNNDYGNDVCADTCDTYSDILANVQS